MFWTQKRTRDISLLAKYSQNKYKNPKSFVVIFRSKFYFWVQLFSSKSWGQFLYRLLSFNRRLLKPLSDISLHLHLSLSLSLSKYGSVGKCLWQGERPRPYPQDWWNRPETRTKRVIRKDFLLKNSLYSSSSVSLSRVWNDFVVGIRSCPHTHHSVQTNQY